MCATTVDIEWANCLPKEQSELTTNNLEETNISSRLASKTKNGVNASAQWQTPLVLQLQ